jgi:predicted DNA-binding WGR domain protein
MNGAILPDPIELVALDPARNIWRGYSITASFDLFGMIVVETRWGRIGALGQAQRHAFADRAAADRHIVATLRRRDTAHKRIGVPYRSRPNASSMV